MLLTNSRPLLWDLRSAANGDSGSQRGYIERSCHVLRGGGGVSHVVDQSRIEV